MTTTLTLKQEDDIEDGTFLRPRDPSNHEQFEQILPWMTPLFCYHMEGGAWVRWSVPPHIADSLGMNGAACTCCGKAAAKDDAGYLVDTAWHETDWWLTANGYALPEGALP